MFVCESGSNTQRRLCFKITGPNRHNAKRYGIQFKSYDCWFFLSWHLFSLTDLPGVHEVIELEVYIVGPERYLVVHVDALDGIAQLAIDAPWR